MPSILLQRDVVNDVKTSFGSWDKCMEKNYCKWPVIIGIIVASLGALAILWCIIQCVCCGASCCCGCFSCCKSCCPSGRRNKGHRQIPSGSHAPPFVGTQYQSPQPISYGGPQYAQFDVSSGNKDKPFNEDALPAMPSWDTAPSKKVEDSPALRQDVELNRLDQDRNDSVHAPMLAHVDGFQNQYPPHAASTGAASQFYSGQKTGFEGGPGYGGGGDVYGQGRYNDDHFAGYSTPSYAQSRRAPSAATRNGAAADYYNSSPYDHPVSPTGNQFNGFRNPPPHAPIGRRPVQGSWRDI